MFIKKLKEISYKSATLCLDKGERIRSSLRKALDDIEYITGIPKTKIFVKENLDWKLNKADIFNPVNDKVNDCLDNISILEEILEINEKPKAKKEMKASNFVITAAIPIYLYPKCFAKDIYEFEKEPSHYLLNGI